MAVQACQGNVSRKMLTDNVCRKHLSLNWAPGVCTIQLLQTAMICFAMSWSVDSEITLESPAVLTGESKKKCFPKALRQTLVVLEMHQAL